MDRANEAKFQSGGSMALETRKISLWDTLLVQLRVSLPTFFSGLVAPNRGFLAWRCRHGAGRSTMLFLAGLREKYRCDHLWLWFPMGTTLLVLAPETMEAVLESDANAADPFLKKRALSRFVPDGVIISSGEEWRDRRRFNETALELGKLHRHHQAFSDIAAAEVNRLPGGELRWADFQALAERISQQVILGAGRLRPEMNAQLGRMVERSNVLMRDEACFGAFYQEIDRDLAQKGPAACLMHESVVQLESGAARASTRVPTQIGFWFFVLKDALELHVARTLALIAAHPEVQSKARAEARAAATQAYVDACLREQLRLWTPVPLLLRRATRNFLLRDEIAVDAEQQILIHTGFYHRDPRIFGEHADTFSPEAADRLPTTYFFSAHRQGCAGRSLVTLMLNETLASLLSRFRFELAGPAIEPGRIPYLYNHFDVSLRAVANA
jgi:cytochrome P450